MVAPRSSETQTISVLLLLSAQNESLTLMGQDVASAHKGEKKGRVLFIQKKFEQQHISLQEQDCNELQDGLRNKVF